MKYLQKLLLVFVSLTILLSTTVPVSALSTIMGVPINKFDNIYNAKERLDTSLTEMVDYPGEYYKLQYKVDAYAYAYFVLEMVELLGVGSITTLEENIKHYNMSVKDPLTPDDEIVFSGTGPDLVVASTAQQFKDKLIKIAGSADKQESDDGSIMAEIGQLRKGAGIPIKEDSSKTYTWEDSSLSEVELEQFIRENISEIRVLLTLAKDYVDYYYEIIDYDTFKEFSAYFTSTYNIFVQFSKHRDIEGLKDLDLFGDDEGARYDPNSPEAHEDIGEWNTKGDKTPTLEKMSEHMLKGIAASATFRPFETDLNSTQAFQFLGSQMQLYHEAFGTKRKLILTPVDSRNDLNTGVDLTATKDLKYMTLQDFITDPDKVKIMYLDNIDYDLSDVDQAQQSMKNKETIEVSGEGDDKEDTITDVTNETVKDDNRGLWANINHGINSVASHMNSNKYLDWLVFDKIGGGMEGSIESLIFATGDVSKVSKVKKSLDENKELINLSTLVYKNIIAEYKGSSKRKLKADLHKPMTVDIYGNILSASGIVIIPAMSNPFIWGGSKPVYLFNRAFIESYPEYVLEEGKITNTRSSKNRMYIYLDPMTDEEVEEQEKRTKEKFSLPDVVTDDTDGTLDDITSEVGGLKFSSSLGQDIVKVLGGVQGYIAKVGKSATISDKTKLPDLKATADKFNNDYEAVKSLDIFSFPVAKGYTLDEYSKVRENISKVSVKERIAVINDYTVKLTYSEEGATEVVTFKELPDSNELKKFLYLSNLRELINVEDGEIVDNVRLSKTAYKIVEQVYANGIYNFNELNSLITDGVSTTYGKYIGFLLEKSNNRHDSVLGVNSANNLMYNATIEETSAMKVLLPYLYRFILVIAIASVIISIITSVFSSEGKFKFIMKAVTVVYLLTFLLQISPLVFEKVVNNPLRWLMTGETISWTILQQEDNLNRVKQTTKDEYADKPVDDGSEIKLYKLDYTYPFKTIRASGTNNMTIDDYYEGYLDNPNAFADQNNRMWVDGRYVVTNTNTLFESSRIVVDNPKTDVLQKLTHEVYLNPEISYYMPYYMFVDNIVHNLNVISDITKRIPDEITYESGDIRSTGRLKSLMSSAIFLDYEEFEKRLDDYVTSDRISDKLTELELDAMVQDYGEHEDFLGIRKILNFTDGLNILPFTEESIDKSLSTAWYPKVDYLMTDDNVYDISRMTYEDKMEFQKAADKVNKKTRNFMLSLYPFTDSVSDETFIKTIALYASFEFNKAFSKWQSNDYLPTSLELKDVSVERLLMAMTIKKEDMLDLDFDSYPLTVIERDGYFGLLTSTYNDFIIVLINYMKPFMTVVVWLMTAAVIFTRKIMMGGKNSSVLGSLKTLGLYTLFSVVYGIFIWGIIKLTEFGMYSWASLILTALVSTLYLVVLIFIMYFMVKDLANLGSSYFFKGTEKLAKTYAQALKGMVGNSVLAKSGGLQRSLNSHASSIEALGGRMENRASRSLSNTGEIDWQKPVDFSTRSINKASSTLGRTSRSVANSSKDLARKTSDGVKNAAGSVKGRFSNSDDNQQTEQNNVDTPSRSMNPEGTQQSATSPKTTTTPINVSRQSTTNNNGPSSPRSSATGRNAESTVNLERGVDGQLKRTSSATKTQFFNRSK